MQEESRPEDGALGALELPRQDAGGAADGKALGAQAYFAGSLTNAEPLTEPLPSRRSHEPLAQPLTQTEPLT